MYKVLVVGRDDSEDSVLGGGLVSTWANVDVGIESLDLEADYTVVTTSKLCELCRVNNQMDVLRGVLRDNDDEAVKFLQTKKEVEDVEPEDPPIDLVKSRKRIKLNLGQSRLEGDDSEATKWILIGAVVVTIAAIVALVLNM